MSDLPRKISGFMPRRVKLASAPTSYGLRSIRRPTRLDLDRIWDEMQRRKEQEKNELPNEQSCAYQIEKTAA
jgi:hypothetical protein